MTILYCYQSYQFKNKVDCHKLHAPNLQRQTNQQTNCQTDQPTEQPTQLSARNLKKKPSKPPLQKQRQAASLEQKCEQRH